jgi:hypothetical protein
VSGLFRRLKEFDNTLTEISLNNMKEVDDVLMAVADFLARMDCVTKISVANTKMNNTIGLVGKRSLYLYLLAMHRPGYITLLYFNIVYATFVIHLHIPICCHSVQYTPPLPRRVCSQATLRGRLHGAFSTPGLNSALLTGLKFFAITWTISTPGLKRYTIRSRHRFAEVKKAFILFSCNK